MIGPPREHGGWVVPSAGLSVNLRLQLSRRVNTADGIYGGAKDDTGPQLQWGRRVNTADGRYGVEVPQV